jgi:hypothetical protein
MGDARSFETPVSDEQSAKFCVPCVDGRSIAVAAPEHSLLRSREGMFNLCRLCGELISVGAIIWPMPEEGVKRSRKTWVHLACAADKLGEPLVAPRCKHYMRNGFCLFRQTCFFEHPPEIAATDGLQAFSEEESRRQGVERAQLRAADGQAAGARATMGRRRNKVRNQHRAATIRRWLVQTYGLDALAAGSGVLEVAGGKGEISFQLVKVNGVAATNVDPRLGSLAKYRRTWQYGYYTRNRATEAQDARVDAPHALAPDAEPRLIRSFFEMDNLRAPPPKAQRRVHAQETRCDEPPPAASSPRPLFARGDGEWEAQRERAAATRWTKKGLVGAEAEAGTEGKGVEGVASAACGCGCDAGEQGHGGGESDDDEGGCDDHPQLVRSLDEAREILGGVSLVVSMHGDAAVDHALEFALAQGIPFCLVPCCVYSELSPWRNHVNTYDQLLAHLEERARRAGVNVARTTLNFEGKNQAIFAVPDDGP